MKKYACFLIILIAQELVLITTSHAQFAVNTSSYTHAIGLRAGGTSGLTYKHWSGNSGFEGILGLWNRGFSLTLLMERQSNAGIAGLNWYYGAGGHIAAYGSGTYYWKEGRYYYPYRSSSGFAIGIDGIVGIEYKIRPIPFAISIDLKPLFEINSDWGPEFGIDPGLGLKFTF